MSKTLLASAAATAALACPLLDRPRPLLVWNASASAPIGLYAVHAERRISRGDLVLVRPPPKLARFLAARGYLPLGVPLLKRVAALPPQTICRRAAAVRMDGATRAVAFGHDRSGRPLPHWSGCRALRQGEIFLLNTSTEYSLDSRYFGPLPARSIIGRATPLWLRHLP
jgi:conjugative transfer signal peptidase TraF